MNIFESVVDYALKHYSKSVFDDYKTNTPVLKERIRRKIQDDVKLISKKITVIDYFIKGSILTKQYSKTSDIDIFIRVKTSIYNEEQIKRLLKPIWEKIDDTYLDGVPYPFQYYITTEEYNFDNTEAAYDVEENEWIKRESSKNIDLEEYLDDFKKYVEQFSDFSEELRRSMIDYEILKDIPRDQLDGLKSKLNEVLNEINNTINEYGETYRELKNWRNEAFSKEMTPTEIKKYGIKTRLPGNVVYKLIERYQYLDLYKKIKKIIGSDGKLSHIEVDKLNQMLKTKLTKEQTSFKGLFESPDYTPSFRTESGPNHYYELDKVNYNRVEYKYILTGGDYKLDHSFGDRYEIYIKKQYDESVFSILDRESKIVVSQVIWSVVDGRLTQTSIWSHQNFRGFMSVYIKHILPRAKGRVLYSDDSQTPEGFNFWKRLFEKFISKTSCGVYDDERNKHIKFKDTSRMNKYHGQGNYTYVYFIKVPNVIEESILNNPFKPTKGRGDLQHKPRHRQQQDNAGMLGHGTRKHINLLPDYQRNTPIKGDKSIQNVKNNNSRIIRVKQGSPEAIRLAKKYRIANPVGKKTVAGNQHDGGITIIFENTDKKIVWSQYNKYITQVGSTFTLWCDTKKIGVLNLSTYASFKKGNWWKVSFIEISKHERGKGYGELLYKTALKNAPDNIQGIISYLPDRSNKKQISKIYKRLGGYEDGDYGYIPKI